MTAPTAPCAICKAPILDGQSRVMWWEPYMKGDLPKLVHRTCRDGEKLKTDVHREVPSK